MTSKVTNFIKQYFFMLALAATFVGFSAFKFSQPELQDLYWFEVSPDGNTITSYINELPADANPLGCSSIPNDYCAMGFDDSDLQNPGTPPTSPSDLKPAVQTSPTAHANERRYLDD